LNAPLEIQNEIVEKIENKNETQIIQENEIKAEEIKENIQKENEAYLLEKSIKEEIKIDDTNTVTATYEIAAEVIEKTEIDAKTEIPKMAEIIQEIQTGTILNEEIPIIPENKEMFPEINIAVSEIISVPEINNFEIIHATENKTNNEIILAPESGAIITDNKIDEDTNKNIAPNVEFVQEIKVAQPNSKQNHHHKEEKEAKTEEIMNETSATMRVEVPKKESSAEKFASLQNSFSENRVNEERSSSKQIKGSNDIKLVDRIDVDKDKEKTKDENLEMMRLNNSKLDQKTPANPKERKGACANCLIF